MGVDIMRQGWPWLCGVTASRTAAQQSFTTTPSGDGNCLCCTEEDVVFAAVHV